MTRPDATQEGSVFSGSRLVWVLSIATGLIVAALLAVPREEAPATVGDSGPDPGVESMEGASPVAEDDVPQAAPVSAGDGTGPWLEIAGRYPLEGDLLKNEIVLYFSDAITVPESEAPFTVTPDPGGEHRVGSNYVAFQSRAIQRGVYYDVRLSEALRSLDGRPVAPDRRTIRFLTTPFRPTKIWTAEETDEQLVIGTVFPVPVALDDLKSHISVQGVNGEAVPFGLTPGPDAKTWLLGLASGSPWPVEITFAGGLADASHLLVMEGDATFTYPSEPLRVTRVAWEEVRGEDQEFLIEFSHPVDAEALAARLKVWDSATEEGSGFEVMTEGRLTRHVVKTHIASQPPVIGIALEQGLKGAEKTSLATAYEYTLRPSQMRGARPKALRVGGSWWDERGKLGLVMRLELNQHVAPEDLKAHLEFVPPVEGLEVQGEWGTRYAVYGDWNSNATYTMRITAGIKFEGEVLDSPIVREIKTGEVPKFVGFAHEGKYYFPNRSGVVLPLESRNVEKTTVSVHRVFPSNIAVALRDMRDGKGTYEFISRWTEELGKSDVKLAVTPDRLAQTPLDLHGLLPEDTKGVFCLKADWSGWPEANKLVLLTNIGVLAHWQSDSLLMFAHDLFSLAPLDRAKVSLYSAKNQLLGVVNTNSQGIARLGAFDPVLGAPQVAVIEHGDDYTFLELTRRSEDPVAFSPDMPKFDREGYDAFIYADRNLYRPGETAHLHWIVRTNYGDALAGVPLLVTVIKPNGRELLSQPTVLGPAGGGGLDLTTQKTYPTGQYRVTLTVPGNKRVIGKYEFHLEDFVPNRIKATVTIDTERWLAATDYAIHVNAQHLFGAPAADRKCEAIVIPRRGGFEPERWKGFRFDNESHPDFTPPHVSCGEVRTDEQGNAAFTFNYTAPEKVTYPMRTTVVGRAFELGGRAVAGHTQTVLFPSDLCLGVNAQPGAGGQGVEVLVAAIRPDEEPADLATVNVTLERRTYSYYVRRFHSHHQSNWADWYEPVETREVTLKDGRGSTAFSPRGYGHFRVRVHSDKTPQFSTQSFYSYGGRCSLVAASQPSLIKVRLDKAEYEPGDEAVVRVEAPFDGHGLVVVHGQELMDMLPVTVQDGVGEVRLWVGEQHFPNVWLEATVVHALQEGQQQVYPFSSFAMANLPVRNRHRELTVALPGLAKEIRPATRASFDVEVRDWQGNPAEVELTLAAVDEGIHTITGYESPDPYAFFSRTRKPDFRRAHYYDKVAYDFEKPAAGGDLDALLGKRAASADDNWIRPLALWSGVVRTDAAGRATVIMDVPEFNGALRLVAVANGLKAAGSVDAEVLVRRPHMLRTSMPRFLLPDDSIQCRAVVFNHTDQPCKAMVRWTAEGALQPGEGSKELPVPANGEAGVEAAFRAGKAVGQGAIQWSVEVHDSQGNLVEELSQRAPIPVRAPAAFQSDHDLIILEPGATRTLRNTAFLDDERTELELTVAAHPIMRLQEALGHVVGYPYGCVEQTTSKLMPMYLLRKSGPLADMTLGEQQRLDDFIQAGIDRLFSMQTGSGGLGGWPGASQPYPYGSVYALHFLTLVKNDREYDVPDKSLEALQKFVRRVAGVEDDLNSSSLYRRAYAIYVLALGGDLDAIKQVRRFDDVVLPRASRYLLAAALALSTEDAEQVVEYLKTAPAEDYDTYERGGTLNSVIRNKAVQLMALVQMGRRDEETHALAQDLFKWLEERRYWSTQQNAFVITALTGYFGTMTGALGEAAATIAGPEGTGGMRGEEVYQARHAGPGGEFTVENTGPVPLMLNLTTRGVPEKAQTESVSEGLSVRRTIYTGRGKRHDGVTFAQGDSYVVGLTIQGDWDLENVVVADLLPAGFEIENPRLDAEILPKDTFEEAITPSYLDVRDDRIVLAFDRLGDRQHRQRKTHQFYYVVRAVTPGLYQYPPVTAECMYDARVRGASEAGNITIK
jgi:alpha-2-macroglobulin